MTNLFLGYPDEGITNWIKENCVDYSKIPLCFEALEGETRIIIQKNKTTTTDISLLYSFDNETWQDWDYATYTFLTSGQKFYVKAKTDNSSSFILSENYVDSGYTILLINGKINLLGNIMSIVYNDFINRNEEDFNYPQFYSLFNAYDTGNMSGIYDASKLILPSIKLSISSYNSMFSNCNRLITGPKLPATELDSYCYSNMFSCCNSLINAPKLPAMTVNYGSGCYQYMFVACYALKEAPDLPALKLGQACYNGMFGNCTSLTKAPNLPSIDPNNGTIAQDLLSYENMFIFCKSIKEIHYPKTLQNSESFLSWEGAPYFGATNATIYYDL